MEHDPSIDTRTRTPLTLSCFEAHPKEACITTTCFSSKTVAFESAGLSVLCLPVPGLPIVRPFYSRARGSVPANSRPKGHHESRRPGRRGR